MNTFDLIIIGAGPGGYEMAVEAAHEGLTVAIVEKDQLGGTCLNRGCIPTKAWCRNAEVINTLKNSEEFGIGDLHYTFDFMTAVHRKNAVVAMLREGVAALMKTPGITLLTGDAVLESANVVTVAGEQYSAKNVVIATGSVPTALPIPGIDLPGVMTSDDILALEQLPQSLCVVGGGVIGMEFAGIFNSFGVAVTVIEFCKEILPNVDKDVAKRLRSYLQREGVNFCTSAAVKQIATGAEGGLEVTYEQKGKTLTCNAEKVLVSVGRRPNIPAGADAVGIEIGRRGIVTDDNLCTNVPGVYAIGDVNGKCMLAHAASFQGKVALAHILGKSSAVKLDIVPGAVFTVPEVGMVGLTEEQCKERGLNFVVKKSLFRANGKALAMGEPDGLLKLMVDADSRKILGCHLCGPHAADLIQEVVVAMNAGLTVDDMKQIIHGHPTLGEVVQAAF